MSGMNDTHELPYGSWPSPISIAMAVAASRGLAEPRPDGASLYFLESRPHEGGRVVLLTDRRLPRVKAGAANAVWRGKEWAADGSFVNRWAGGVRAIGSQAVIGPSWADGRPAVVMEYPPGTPLFANTRDELREVAPGLYLGAFYDRCPCPRLRGYFALTIDPCR